jgi:hypothetical protein
MLKKVDQTQLIHIMGLKKFERNENMGLLIPNKLTYNIKTSMNLVQVQY